MNVRVATHRNSSFRRPPPSGPRDSATGGRTTSKVCPTPDSRTWCLESEVTDQVHEIRLHGVLRRTETEDEVVILSPDASRIEAALDWGSLYAMPPAYDLAFVELQLVGADWLALPGVQDRRPLVREGLLAGYRERRPVPPAFGVQRDCYQLDAMLGWMSGLGENVTGRAIPAHRTDDAVAGLRSLVERQLP